MGILSKVYICPDKDCPNIEEGKEGYSCPECGTEYKKVVSFQADNIKTFKIQYAAGKTQDQIVDKEIKTIEKQEPKVDKSGNHVLFDDKMVDSELRAKIFIDMDNLARHEANTGWIERETALSSKPEAQIMAMGLKAIIDQNKLIIQQNELIYRELKRINEKSN